MCLDQGTTKMVVYVLDVHTGFFFYCSLSVQCRRRFHADSVVNDWLTEIKDTKRTFPNLVTAISHPLRDLLRHVQTPRKSKNTRDQGYSSGVEYRWAIYSNIALSSLLLPA